MDFDRECRDPHTVASLLKMYLRELPEPLVTYEGVDSLLRAYTEPGLTDDDRVKRFERILARLPRPNKILLWHVITFAAELPRHRQKNKMTIENVAVCLAPTLLWRRPEDLDALRALNEAGFVIGVAKLVSPFEKKEGRVIVTCFSHPSP